DRADELLLRERGGKVALNDRDLAALLSGEIVPAALLVQGGRFLARLHGLREDGRGLLGGQRTALRDLLVLDPGEEHAERLEGEPVSRLQRGPDVPFDPALQGLRVTHYRAASFCASRIAAFTPWDLRIVLTRACCAAFSPRIVPMYWPWSLRAARWPADSLGRLRPVRVADEDPSPATRLIDTLRAGPSRSNALARDAKERRILLSSLWTECCRDILKRDLRLGIVMNDRTTRSPS